MLHFMIIYKQPNDFNRRKNNNENEYITLCWFKSSASFGWTRMRMFCLSIWFRFEIHKYPHTHGHTHRNISGTSAVDTLDTPELHKHREREQPHERISNARRDINSGNLTLSVACCPAYIWMGWPQGNGWLLHANHPAGLLLNANSRAHARRKICKRKIVYRRRRRQVAKQQLMMVIEHSH